MIPRAHITAWRSAARWLTDAQVEQDLAIARALVDLYSDPWLSTEIAFRGGTAIHKLLFTTAGRYSEDIDLVQLRAGPIGPVMNAIRARLDPWLGKPQWKQSEGRVTIAYRFESEMKPTTPLRLKVEINTREHFTVLGHEQRAFAVENPWYGGEAQILTYSPEELLGTKLRALYQRKKGRDLFDLSEALAVLPGLDEVKIVECFTRYMDHQQRSVSRAELEANLYEKMSDELFRADVPPLLPSGVTFDPDAAIQRVQDRLIKRVSGAPWKGPSASA